MYQWQKDGVNIATGANSATYTIAAVAESDEGEYRCVVSNAANSVTSIAASLTECKQIKSCGEGRLPSSLSPSFSLPLPSFCSSCLVLQFYVLRILNKFIHRLAEDHIWYDLSKGYTSRRRSILFTVPTPKCVTNLYRGSQGVETHPLDCVHWLFIIA